jgi:hypothetical protein
VNPASVAFGSLPSVTILEAVTKKTNDSKSLPNQPFKILTQPTIQNGCPSMAACIRKIIGEKSQSSAPFNTSLEVPGMDAASTARVEIKRIRPVW